jgi:hypothetical protein
VSLRGLSERVISKFKRKETNIKVKRSIYLHGLGTLHKNALRVTVSRIFE